MKKVRKIRKISKIKKVRKKRLYIPRTKDEVGTSKFEKNFGLFLQRLGLEIETQFNIGYKFYDFKIKNKNIIIEADGDFYHKNPETHGDYPATAMQRKNMKNDIFKNKLAEANGYRLLRIWESDFNKKKIETTQKILKFINE
jgi:very-short-patch-repair endonuclease